MVKFFKKILNRMGKGDDRGLTLVEVLCAVAILGLVSGVIGGIVVISARTYGKGMAETDVQQEAQLAANNIGNLIKDAYSVDFKDGTLYMDTNSGVEYAVMYDSDTNQLYYAQYDISGEESDPVQIGSAEVLAGSVTDFDADTTSFEDNRTITMTMTVWDENTGRNIPMTYTMTSRNEAGTGVEYVEVDVKARIYIDGSVILVPGEVYYLPYVLYGSEETPAVEIEGDSVDARIDESMGCVVLAAAESAEGEYTLTISTGDKEENGDPEDTATCKVRIRRVNSVSVTHAVNTKNAEEGMLEGKGAVFTFSASVSGTYLTKQTAYDYDEYYAGNNNYAQAVYWSWEINDGTNTYTGDYETNGLEWENDYIKVTSCTEDASYPQIVFKVKKTLPDNFVLTVTALSQHADGENKAWVYYDEVKDSDKVSARDPRITSELEITLEPNEEDSSLTLNMKGGLSELELVAEGNTSEDTYAEYSLSTDTVTIKLGEDEEGSGCEDYADLPYTFVFNVYKKGYSADDEALAVIIVHVRRIDKMSIEVFDNYEDSDGYTMAYPTYDFRGRINVDDGQTVNELLAYLIDDADCVEATLATEISWELKNTEKNEVIESGAVLCYGFVDEDGTSGNQKNLIVDLDTGQTIKNLGGFSNYTYKVGGQTIYTIENIKHARVQVLETDEKGNPTSYFVKQFPEIDVSFSSPDNVTGLPDNTEFTVRMQMLHPCGTYMIENTGSNILTNKTGFAYLTDPVYAEATIKSDAGLSTDEETIFVEPGQGWSYAEDSDQELVIPIYATGAVYTMKAKISGNSSSATKVIEYGTENDRYGNDNPYLAENAKSDGDGDLTRTWYLGLNIDTGETGTDGLIYVTVDAYNATGTLIDELKFTLALRAVTKVTVTTKNGSTLSSANKVANTVTLIASPTGYSGTDYYDKQTYTDSEGNTVTCRWETEGHGEYQSPAPMEWYMDIGDGTGWKPLSEWTDYVSNISVNNTSGNGEYYSQVSFKVVQELPVGTIIRAYSLHAQGTVADDTDKTTKTNKSGKRYGTVYGDIEVSASWKRGETVCLLDWLPDDVFYTENGVTGWANSYGTGIEYTSHDLAVTFYSKYEQPTTGKRVVEGPAYYNISLNSSSVGGDRCFTSVSSVDNDVSAVTATLFADDENWAKSMAYSSAYPSTETVWWKDINCVHLEITINGTTYTKDYDIADVEFWYRNSLPDTYEGNKNYTGDEDDEWTDTLVVYVTDKDKLYDDSNGGSEIKSVYKTYYKLTDGWEESYENYTLFTGRYIGVASDGSKFTDFAVTNTKGTGETNGRSYVSFTFENVSEHKGDVVQMIYEYNPFLDNDADCYANYENYNGKGVIAGVDGCEGILEFHFEEANIEESLISEKASEGPQVGYCPYYGDDTTHYYYISSGARFKITGTSAEYQTASCTDTSDIPENWSVVKSMTYNTAGGNSDKWTEKKDD